MLQKRYEGYLKTPYLWENNSVFELQQLDSYSRPSSITIPVDESLRLGKYIERFVVFELQQQQNISIIADNIQIQNGKITQGELDCLFLKNSQPIHLEIIYKFYLYDASIGTTEIEHFIGPNRKDTLIEKLTKLKNKQFSLLFTNACKPYLNSYNLEAEKILQQVCFKAQLFVPYKNNIQLKTLNNNCIVGFYINKSHLSDFYDCKFYIPIKKDWLLVPHTNVNWLSFIDFEKNTSTFSERKFSSLCWIKFKNGELNKFFFVWW